MRIHKIKFEYMCVEVYQIREIYLDFENKKQNTFIIKKNKKKKILRYTKKTPLN